MKSNLFGEKVKNNNINTPTAVFIDGGWLYTATRRINKNVDYANFFNTLIKKFGGKKPRYIITVQSIQIINSKKSFIYRSKKLATLYIA